MRARMGRFLKLLSSAVPFRNAEEASRKLTECLRDRGGIYASFARIFLLVVIANDTWQSFSLTHKYTSWQTMTRSMAAALGPGTQPVHIWGDVMSQPEATTAGIQRPRALSWRLEYPTGRTVYLCDVTPKDCAGKNKPDAATQWRVVHGQTQHSLVLPQKNTADQ